MASMKRIAVFLDGTWNDSASSTNVWRLSRLVADQDAQGVAQLVYYDPGVGTKKFEKIRGGAVGFGLSKNVQAAYAWIKANYQDGDEVYIFGFSRGAYTARSLGGLIAGCGLAKPGAPFTDEYLYNRYQLRKDEALPIYKLQFIHENSKERELTEEEARLLEFSRRIKIKMMGVWDTVGALGVPWTGMPLLGRDKFYFHNPNLSTIYENAFHAMAIDENRGAYKPTLWTKYEAERPDGSTPPRPAMPQVANIEQRWFVGAHANVGGGYRNDTLNLPSLAWMQEKANGLGLHFTSPIVLEGDEIRTEPVDSYAKFMWHIYQALTLNRRFWRPIGIPVNKVKTGWSYPVNEYIDASVFRRCADFPKYRPKNLLDWCVRTGRRLDQTSGDQPAC
jgi:uncharacterized protein (DUF2235 family)